MTLHTIGAAIRVIKHGATQGMQVIFHTPSLERPERKGRKDVASKEDLVQARLCSFKRAWSTWKARASLDKNKLGKHKRAHEPGKQASLEKHNPGKHKSERGQPTGEGIGETNNSMHGVGARAA